MIVEIKSTPQSGIRSNQSGDWYYDDDSITVHVLETLPPESQLAIAVHEMTEAFLCRRAGISDDAIVAFDDQYEREREEGKHPNNTEPGDAEDSIYLSQHQAATHCERAVCHALDLAWAEHDRSVNGS